MIGFKPIRKNKMVKIKMMMLRMRIN